MYLLMHLDLYLSTVNVLVYTLVDACVLVLIVFYDVLVVVLVLVVQALVYVLVKALETCLCSCQTTFKFLVCKHWHACNEMKTLRGLNM